MAIYNEILSARFSRSLQKMFGMKGAQASKQLAGEITAAVTMFYGAEARYLESWNRFGFYQEITLNAGLFQEMRLRNPTGSNVVAVIEKVQCATPAADQFELSQGSSATDLTSVFALTGTRFDPRGNPTTTMVASSRQTAGSSALGLRAKAYVPANTTIDFISTDIQEFPLLPGDAIHLRSFVLNNTSAFGVWWRERIMEESELK